MERSRNVAGTFLSNVTFETFQERSTNVPSQLYFRHLRNVAGTYHCLLGCYGIWMILLIK